MTYTNIFFILGSVFYFCPFSFFLSLILLISQYNYRVVLSYFCSENCSIDLGLQLTCALHDFSPVTTLPCMVGSLYNAYWKSIYLKYLLECNRINFTEKQYNVFRNLQKWLSLNWSSHSVRYGSKYRVFVPGVLLDLLSVG